jgi:hypothetical protein
MRFAELPFISTAGERRRSKRNIIFSTPFNAGGGYAVYKSEMVQSNDTSASINYETNPQLSLPIKTFTYC